MWSSTLTLMSVLAACRAETSTLGVPQVGKLYHVVLVDDALRIDDNECLVSGMERCDEWTAACAMRHTNTPPPWVCSGDCVRIGEGVCLVVPTDAIDE